MVLFRKIFHPILYQGRKKRDHYFEGWYYKQVSSDQNLSIAFIPGICKNKNDPHAFIQIIISDVPHNQLLTHYFRYPLSEFRYTNNPFGLLIGRNRFSENSLSLDMEDGEYRIGGYLSFESMTPIRVSVFSPNIMGFFGYFRFMECYHGIISMNHHVSGFVSVNETQYDFSQGKGYIEKDWGKSFPQKYIWIQCNHFSDPDVSLMLSIARIPFMGLTFRGFISILNLHGREYRFATYNFAHLQNEEHTTTDAWVILKKRKYILEIEAHTSRQTTLRAPKSGIMDHVIKEGLSGEVRCLLKDNQGKILLDSWGSTAGIEITDNYRNIKS
jgi:hypothetical protein